MDQDSINLNYCGQCGGRLKLIEGTDPDVAEETGVWEEIYECQGRCGQRGKYKVDQTGPEMLTRGTGVVG